MTQIGRSGPRDGPGDQRGSKLSNGMTSRPGYFAAWDDPLSVHALFRCFQGPDVAPTPSNIYQSTSIDCENQNVTFFIQGLSFGAQRGAFFARMNRFHGFLGSYLFYFDAVVNRLGALKFRLPLRK